MEMEEISKEPESNVAKDEGASAAKSEEETDVYSNLHSPTEDLYEETKFATGPSKTKAGYFQDVRLWRCVSACFGVICLILILVIAILAIKLQNASSVAVCRDQQKSRFLEPASAVLCKRRQSTQCAPGWLQFGESCFFLSSLRKTWAEAQTNCSAMKGDLAVVSSPSVQKFLTESGRLTYWIGLRGNTWVNGRSLTQSYWSDTSTKGYCVLLQSKLDSDKNWFYSSCTLQTYYICERPVSNN